LEYKPTTNKLTESRMIKFALIGIAVLLVVQIIAYGFSWWVAQQIIEAEPEKVAALQRIAEILLGIPGGGGIATIITAVVARYGLREATGNLGEGMRGK